MFEADQKTVQWTVFPTNGVWALVVIKGDPAPDANPSLRPCLPSVQINAFIRQRPPEALVEDGVHAATFAAHR